MFVVCSEKLPSQGGHFFDDIGCNWELDRGQSWLAKRSFVVFGFPILSLTTLNSNDSRSRSVIQVAAPISFSQLLPPQSRAEPVKAAQRQLIG